MLPSKKHLFNLRILQISRSFLCAKLQTRHFSLSRRENITSDILQGCAVVTLTLLAFIGLVWLREQVKYIHIAHIFLKKRIILNSNSNLPRSCTAAAQSGWRPTSTTTTTTITTTTSTTTTRSSSNSSSSSSSRLTKSSGLRRRRDRRRRPKPRKRYDLIMINRLLDFESLEKCGFVLGLGKVNRLT